MDIYIDADACPVQKEAIYVAQKNDLKVFLVKSYAHFSTEILPNNVEVIYVDYGKDMADLAIIQKTERHDIVITQDYGLASLCLGKGCHVLHHKGFLYTENNIDQLLASRYASAKARKAGRRTKGPRPFTDEERNTFVNSLQRIIDT